MKKMLVLLFWLLAFFLKCYAQNNDNYYFSTIGLKNGLSQISVLKILQDSKGYLWFGTRNGLNKFDGTEFTVYKHNHADTLSLSDNHIITLLEDRNDNLWVGTINGLNKLNLKDNSNTSFLKDKCSIFGHGVRSLFIDSKNRLWIGTSGGLCTYIKEVNEFQIIDLNGKIKDEFISVIYETYDHKLVIGTASKGFFVCDMNLKVIKHYSDNIINPGNSNNVATIYEDSRHQLWIGYTHSGLARIDLNTGEVVSFTKDNSGISTNNVRCLAEHNGTLFVGTFDGLYAVDILTGKTIRHSNANLEKGNLSHFSIYSLCIDTAGTIWVGSYSGGVNYFNKYNNRFRLHEPTDVSNQILGIFGSMVCKPPCNMYISTEGSGLLDYNLQDGTYNYYLMEQSEKQIFSQNIVKTVMLEGDIVWCGTNKGLLYKFDTKSKRFSLYTVLPNNASIYSICRTADNSLWIGTSNPTTGLYKITPDMNIREEFELENGKKLSISSMRCIKEIRDGLFLFGSRNNGLYKYDEKNKTLEKYNTDATGSHKLLSNYITTILMDSKKRIWIGTFGGGIVLFDERAGVLKNVTTMQGLIDDDVCAIVEDKTGMLWVSTNNGISKYDPETDELSNYDQFSGIGIQEFSPHSGVLLPNGDISFSGNNGFITFDPDELHPNTFVPPVVLTKLFVNNKEIKPSEEGILQYVINETNEISLTYDQNNISIGYCALNYIFPDQNQYQYRLVGHDKDWNYVGNRKEAYYTNLNPGTYTFEIKASNNDGIWNDTPKTLSIVIDPPLWKTWYAYVFYVILVISVFGLIIYYISSKQRLEQELKYKQLEKQQLEEFHQTKIRLFTNFSHELRTPLTLIIAPLQELLKINDFTASVKNKLALISSNSQRLLLLVNQLMDLRKNQEGKLPLKIAKDDIYSFVEEIYYAFNQIALTKNIIFKFKKEGNYKEAWFDKSSFEKVVFNLLSNAFKYTEVNGLIELSVKPVLVSELSQEHREELENLPTGTSFIHLSVSDTGKGIPASEMKNIFSPFYRVEKDDNSSIGTGIGLSLTQSIVKTHHGIIWVDSHEPSGAVFNVVIPVSRSVYNDDQIVNEYTTTGMSDVLPSTTPLEEINIEKKHSILLVEDNNNVRTYIKECLESYFFILEADNGIDAFDLAVDKYPDLIISDIMMPGMDGIQLCTEVKKDLRIGHIPVVLMTAKSMVMHIKEGFSVGADDYIVKPFNVDLLIYRVRNLLDSREKLKQLYGKKFSPDSLGIEIVSGDDRFTQKFFKVIEENIANSELNIDLLSREIGLSRANMYRKLRAITELSPTELIRNKRLEIAAKLLSESDMSISEISGCVGFNSHAYFTNSFKLVYGYSPTEFMRIHRGDKG